jgi:hypothetical protein
MITTDMVITPPSRQFFAAIRLQLISSGCVLFVDGAGVKRTLDVATAPFGLGASEVGATALSVEILDDASSPSGVRFYVMHPVLCMESRVHNVVGLPDAYDNEHGRRQLRASILIAREFVRDLLDERIDAEDAVRATIKLNERIFRFCIRDRHAKELFRSSGVDPAVAIHDDPRLPAAFRERRLPQMREQLAAREG